jgi:hypothetical protein
MVSISFWILRSTYSHESPAHLEQECNCKHWHTFRQEPSYKFFSLRSCTFLTGDLLSLTVRLGRIFTVLDNEVDRILRLSREVALNDVLGAVGVTLLCIQGSAADLVVSVFK